MDTVIATEDALGRLAEAATLRHTPSGDGQMVWRMWGEDRGLADRSPLPAVLLHGGAGSWRHWARTVPALAEERLVIVPDLPGLGESAMPHDDHHEAVAAVVAAGLTQTLPGQAVHLVGFSFGGLIGGWVAAQLEETHPGRIASITLLGANFLGLPRNPIVLEKIRPLAGEARAAAHRANLATLMIADPAKIDALALAIQETNTQTVRLRRRPPIDGPALRDALARTRVPLSGIYGEHDATAYPEVPAREAVFRALRDRYDFRVVPGAGHWVAYEAPETVNPWLSEILQTADRRA